MSILDLSLTIDNDCLTCGTPWHEKVHIEQMGKIDQVGRNTSKIVLGSHTATHMDAPKHFFDEGKGIESINLDICLGPVTCVDFQYISTGNIVKLDDIKKIPITERMLFVFGWHKKWKTLEYYVDFPFFSKDAIQYLLDKGIRLIAMDTPSPDSGNGISQFDDSPNHKLLLSANVIIVEYLTNTNKIDFTKHYEIIALPLKVFGADGAPARVILREVY